MINNKIRKKRTGFFQSALFILPLIMVASCSSTIQTQDVIAEPPPAKTDTLKWVTNIVQPAPVQSAADEILPLVGAETEEYDTLFSDSLADEIADNEDMEAENEWAELSSKEKLDSTAKLLDAAITLQEEGDMLMAVYYYNQMRDLIELIDKNDSEIDTSEYDLLVDNVEHFYHDYIGQVTELPEEISPDAVIAGVEIAEGDTAALDSDITEVRETDIEFINIDSLLSVTKVLPPVPIDTTNEKVRRAIQFFQTKGRKVFTRWLERAEYFVPMMQKILREQGMPEELVYLSMIESGFNNKAYSYAHASGPWQFIRGTGKKFGLKSDYWYDERRDPYKSTIAASQYLKSLYYLFDDWYLAMASYNCGEGKVARHTKKYHTNDFWKLNKLPRQTRNYVPTYLAAAAIALNPAAYGFDEVVHKNLPSYDSVMVTECIDLKLIADLVDTSYECIKELNPAIVRWCTPPSVDSIWLKIPSGKADTFYGGVAGIPKEQKRSWVHHKVKSGETLSKIARKYGVTEKAIMEVEANHIRNKHRLSRGQELLIPVPPYKYRDESTIARVDDEEDKSPQSEKFTYTVRRGDNLGSISARFGVSVSKIKQWNNLWGKRYIYPGQKLTLWRKGHSSEPIVEAPTKPTYKNNKKTSSVSAKVHRVKAGESLWQIADKYNISLQELKRLNNLTGKCVIRPGDELRLTDSGSGDDDYASKFPLTHTVRRGDTLWDIASAYGVRVSEIKQLNGLRSNSVIKPGDKLKIPTK